MVRIFKDDKGLVMNVLIIYPFYNQRELMHNFGAKLAEGGIIVDSICINNFHYDKNTSLKWPKSFMLGIKVVNKNRVKQVVRGLGYVTRRWLLPKLFSQYNLVDFHAYYPMYNPLMRTCVENGIKFDITLWGSDLMRANNERKELLIYGFDRAYRLKMSENLHDVLKKSYGTIYDNKCRIGYFGNSGLYHIDSLNDEDAVVIKQELYGDTKGKRIVVLGYNGIPSQNHDVMINAINQLSLTEKDSICVVLPMTYGAPKGYISEIKKIIEATQISYTILDKFLKPEQVAAIRKTADIVVNVQNTDALAGSLQDHLYCGDVCIFGEWLNYSPYINNGIYYIKTSKEELVEHLKDVLHNFEKYHQRCIGNHDIIKKLFSWDATIKKQIAIYGE